MQNRASMFESLRLAKQAGLMPRTVIDVGASVGTLPLLSLFPDAYHLLVEPIAENEPHLRRICEWLQSGDYVIAAAGSTSGTVKIGISQNLAASEIIGQEHQLQEVPLVIQRDVMAITVDDLVAEKQAPAPYLLKIDVDGMELDVVEGAVRTLQGTDYVVVENSPFNPRLHRLIERFVELGFVLYDLVDLGYRQSDGALFLMDLVFVKQDSVLRSQRSYFNPADLQAYLQGTNWRNREIAALNQFLATPRR